MKHLKYIILMLGNTPRNILYHTDSLFVIGTLLFSCIFFFQNIKGWSADSDDSNEQLLRQYVQSKGTGIITFDTSNIKQFWIDNSVISQKNFFEVLLKNNVERIFESVPLTIQLADVNETQDCRIEVIADADNFSFSVLNKISKVVSASSPEDDFLHYKVASAILHMEDTSDLNFSLKFRSEDSGSLVIKKVILSFSDNKNSSFLVSPGVLHFSGNDMDGGNINGFEIDEDNHSFSVSGKRIVLLSRKKILIGDKELSHSVTIKNTGNSPTTIYFGYAPYTKAHQHLYQTNVPYNNKNTVFRIVSSEANSNIITVDALPEWEKGCSLVLNAKEDLSDFPNFSFVNGTISEVRKLDDGHAEIVMDKPVQFPIKKGTKARIQAKQGNPNLYILVRRLNPGEEVTFASKIRKDENFLQFSSEAFCRGTYYAAPLILSHSVNPDEENKIRITDFTVSY